ncbi:MAG: hypothetical protein G01um101418_46 [Parcubacteria group bacterium Gr01-1014_18]|nr:MAG: hypothetical protein Greene041636_46 [Parcubacteria group bacterium Greene0416_36]TSC81552.1 MAG: hypothetical protein G01um101418_46 [Parcubacteria group bacterium Gr01-1014_18]TSC99637.1 MAG: hypothetical protein Greene101420_41 [Parcubacteria group bacterium Greene1014_20]TSD07088.1 MAG: hypothetical protein Greene07142_400 [Parcubacteria group bacterium Greene0714_2]
MKQQNNKPIPNPSLCSRGASAFGGNKEGSKEISLFADIINNIVFIDFIQKFTPPPSISDTAPTPAISYPNGVFYIRLREAR